MAKKNLSTVLFGDVDKMEEERHRNKAKPVVEALRKAKHVRDEAQADLDRAGKKLKKIEKSLAKYKKSGDLKHLEFANPDQ
jgi:hypothetical protein